MKQLDFSRLIEAYNTEFAEDDLTFDWPETTPTEVRLSVGVDKFDSSADKYYMPFCCVRLKAIRVWGLVVCAIECIIIAICLLLNLIHFGSSLPGCTNLTPYLIFLTTLTEIAIFSAYKVMFVFALRDHNAKFLKAHLAFQYATMVVLCINICYSFAILFGPNDAKPYYASNETSCIEAAGWISLAFLALEIYFRMCTYAVSRLIIDYKKFCHQIRVYRWQYRKKCHFSFSSIAQEQMELAARLAANRLMEEKQRQKIIEEQQRLDEEREKALKMEAALAEEDRIKQEQERHEAEQKLEEEKLKLQEQIKKTEALEAARAIEEIEYQQQEVGVTYEKDTAAKEQAVEEAEEGGQKAAQDQQASSSATDSDEEVDKYPSSLEGSEDDDDTESKTRKDSIHVIEVNK